jgi:hypothetical protein
MLKAADAEGRQPISISNRKPHPDNRVVFVLGGPFLNILYYLGHGVAAGPDQGTSSDRTVVARNVLSCDYGDIRFRHVANDNVGPVAEVAGACQRVVAVSILWT